MSLLPMTHDFTTLDNPISPTAGYPGKDRYSNILPVAASQVRITNGYINANHIHVLNQQYICCQAPLENTIGDMWQMIWEHQCQIIVMLASYSDIDRGRATVYWPQIQETYGNIEVCTIKCHAISMSIVVRTFKLLCAGEERIVTHIHFTDWPDFGVPDFPSQFISLLNTVNSIPTGDSPIVVHCSAGIGRSGVFIATHSALNHLKQNHPTAISVKDIIETMRYYRNGMVQTAEQYKFIDNTIRHQLRNKPPPPPHCKQLPLPFADVNTFLLMANKQ